MPRNPESPARRLYAYSDAVDREEYTPDKETVRKGVHQVDANLILSETDKQDIHMPALDIDGIHCELKESSTPGHYHLYIDKEMSWGDYELLLQVLTTVGIIEPKYFDYSMQKGYTALRTGKRKIPRDKGTTGVIGS
jgi:hypothetical protein